MTADEFAEIVLALPGVERGTSYGEPSFKLAGRFFTRVRAEDGAAVIKAGLFFRDALIATDPGVFYVTPHYENGPYVLVRLNLIAMPVLEALLWEAWERCAPPKLLREHAARTAGVPS